MFEYFIVCCSDKKKNKMTDFITNLWNEQNNIETNQRKTKNIKFTVDFTHALVNDGTQRYFLKERKELPKWNEIENSICISHTYWRRDKRELDGYQNMEASLKLMMICKECARLQNLEIKHCHCIDIISNHDLLNRDKNTNEIKVRHISLNMQNKDENNLYLMPYFLCEYALTNNELGSLEMS